MAATQLPGHVVCSHDPCSNAAEPGYMTCLVHLEIGRRSAARRGPMSRCRICRARKRACLLVDRVCLKCDLDPNSQLTIEDAVRAAERRKHKMCVGPCGQVLPTTEFNARAAAKDGLQSYCVTCSRQLRNELAAEKRETPAPYVRKKVCWTCFGIEDNRPVTGCKACREPYRSLDAQIEERKAEIRAGFGQGKGHLYPNNAFALGKEKKLPGRKSVRA